MNSTAPLSTTGRAPALSTRYGEPVMLRGVRVTGDLRGPLFEARIEQRFCNESPDSVEVIYTFELPAGAVLLDVAVQLGERHLVGQVVARRSAELRYEEALCEGQTAVMLEVNADGSHTLNLGHLRSGESCVITLRHVSTLALQQGSLRLIVPTVISPRYGDAQRDAGLQPQQVPRSSVTAEYPFELSVWLHGPLARARVASPSHAIAVDPCPQPLADAAAGTAADVEPLCLITLAQPGWLDRDFVLVLDRLVQDSIALYSAAQAQVDGPLDGPANGPSDTQTAALSAGRVAALLSLRVALDAAGRNRPAAVKFLVDCSGSMAGGSIEAARRALAALVGQLEARDHFSLSRFGDMVEHRSRALWPVTPASRQTAHDWVGALQANLGGTEMAAALQSVLALPAEGRADVLLITDGQVWAVDQVVGAARAGGQRVFVVGIGHEAREAALGELAVATGGACEFVLHGEAVEAAILRMFARLRSPHCSDLQLRWPAPQDAALWLSLPGGSVFDGDTVHLRAWLPHLPSGPLVLHGRCDGEPVELGRLTAHGAPLRGDLLPRLVAASELDEWRAAHADEPLSPAMTELALRARLVTPGTNFLLVDEARVPAADELATMPVQHVVAQMMTAGHAGWGDAAAAAAAPLEMYSFMAIQRAPAHDAFFDPASALAPTSASAMRPLRSLPDDRAPRVEQPASGVRQVRRRSAFDVAPPGAGVDPISPPLPDGPLEWVLPPSVLQQWLTETDRDEWPRSWKDLQALGVPAQLIDRLRASMNGLLDEARAVADLLELLADWDWAQDGPASAGSGGRERQRLLELLAGIGSEDWPGDQDTSLGADPGANPGAAPDTRSDAAPDAYREIQLELRR